MDFDVIIIGAGPGGLTAGIYCGRANLRTLILEGVGAGGQVNYTSKIDNYPGFSGVGAELAEKMKAQALESGAEIRAERVKEIANAGADVKIVRTRRGEYRARAVVIATGAVPRKLGVDGEERLAGAGVSYCATCDGAFFKDKNVVVAGGGNTAFEEALYLANFCASVRIVHRRETFRASASLVEKAKKNPKITILTNEKIEKIQGENTVKSVVLRHTLSSRISLADTDAVFVAAGRVPQSELAENIAKTDENGYILTDENMRTSTKGIYAVGDVRKTPLRQIVTAAADGAIAANDIAATLA